MTDNTRPYLSESWPRGQQAPIRTLLCRTSVRNCGHAPYFQHTCRIFCTCAPHHGRARRHNRNSGTHAHCIHAHAPLLQLPPPSSCTCTKCAPSACRRQTVPSDLGFQLDLNPHCCIIPTASPLRVCDRAAWHRPLDCPANLPGIPDASDLVPVNVRSTGSRSQVAAIPCLRSARAGRGAWSALESCGYNVYSRHCYLTSGGGTGALRLQGM